VTYSRDIDNWFQNSYKRAERLKDYYRNLREREQNESRKHELKVKESLLERIIEYYQRREK